LCRARLEALRGVLGPTGDLIEWVGVASRPAPVVNLNLDPDRAADALVRAFAASARVGDGRGDAVFEALVADLKRRLASEPWLWDQTPPFTWEGETRQGFLRAQVRDGRIVAARDDRSLNMSNMVGKRFFDSELFEYITSREVT
jgi:hypothetical protein